METIKYFIWPIAFGIALTLIAMYGIKKDYEYKMKKLEVMREIKPTMIYMDKN